MNAAHDRAGLDDALRSMGGQLIVRLMFWVPRFTALGFCVAALVDHLLPFAMPAPVEASD